VLLCVLKAMEGWALFARDNAVPKVTRCVLLSMLDAVMVGSICWVLIRCVPLCLLEVLGCRR